MCWLARYMHDFEQLETGLGWFGGHSSQKSASAYHRVHLIIQCTRAPALLKWIVTMGPDSGVVRSLKSLPCWLVCLSPCFRAPLTWRSSPSPLTAA